METIKVDSRQGVVDPPYDAFMLKFVHFGASMTASGGPRLSYGVSNSSPMRYRSSLELWGTSRSRADRSCARHRLRCGPSGLEWYSILVLSVILVTLVASAHSQSTDEMSGNRSALNREIYLDAFAALNKGRVKTGQIYNATLPGNITNTAVELVQMVRLRTGSLRRYGFQFNEITLPKGARVVERLRSVILVYRKFGQYSYYNVSLGNVFVAPLVGILVYDAADYSNYINNIRPELTIESQQSPIQVQLQSSRSSPLNVLNCIMYNNTINGTAFGTVKNFNLSAPCSWNMLGDYSLLGPILERSSSSNTWKIVLGSVLGAVGLLLLLGLTVLLALRYRRRTKFAKMESKSDQGETLHHAFIGGSRAPAAASTRTKPTLENEDVS